MNKLTAEKSKSHDASGLRVKLLSKKSPRVVRDSENKQCQLFSVIRCKLKKIKVGLPASIVADQPSFLPSVLEGEGRAAGDVTCLQICSSEANKSASRRA